MKIEIELSREEIQKILLEHFQKEYSLQHMDAELRLEAYGAARLRLEPRNIWVTPGVIPDDE